MLRRLAKNAVSARFTVRTPNVVWRGLSGPPREDAEAMVGLAGIPVLPHRMSAHNSITLDVDMITGDYAKNRYAAKASQCAYSFVADIKH